MEILGAILIGLCVLTIIMLNGPIYEILRQAGNVDKKNDDQGDSQQVIIILG